PSSPIDAFPVHKAKVWGCHARQVIARRERNATPVAVAGRINSEIGPVGCKQGLTSQTSAAQRQETRYVTESRIRVHSASDFCILGLLISHMTSLSKYSG
ncbi:MAG TPA: hypothetical protein PKI20_20415, partial [Verrucomicrobiota bacterium]|nr:hypothetical protein [Verrucomicrobiota bacterium]